MCRKRFSLIVSVLLLLSGISFSAEMSSEFSTLLEDESSFVSALLDAYNEQTEALTKAEVDMSVLLQTGSMEVLQKRLTEAQNRMDSLRAAFETGVSRYPDNAKLQNAYGEMLYDQYDEVDKAVRCWERAKELDPELGLAYNNLGIYYMHAGAYTLGLENLDAALKTDEEHPDYLFNMVQAYMNHAAFVAEIRGWDTKKVYREAMKLSKRAVKNAPEDYELLSDYALNFWKAESLGLKADWKDAAKAWENARKYAGEEDRIFLSWLMEARAWIEAEKPKQALTCLDEALKINPGSDVAKRLRTQLTEDEAE